MKNLKEKFLNNLTDTVCEILKRYASGSEMSSHEYVVVQLYLRELDKQESKEAPNKLMEGFKFLKENLGFLFKEPSSDDNYQINVEDNSDE